MTVRVIRVTSLRALVSEDWSTAGWSFERASGWLPGGLDKEAWEALIPNLGYMALLRNLRNFDEAGIDDDVAARVCKRLTNPVEVKKSRQFPIRFLSAYKAVNNLRWAYALEQALNLSLANVPALGGRTLIMSDVSGSMIAEQFLDQFHSGWRKRNPFTMPWEHAAIFGLALAARADHADFFPYGQVTAEFKVPRGAASILPMLTRMESHPAFGTGTDTIGLLATLTNLERYDRVVILTDEQAFAAPTGAFAHVDSIPRIYTFNIGGLAPGHLPSGAHGRYTFAGLTDAAFSLLPMIEGRADGLWPRRSRAPTRCPDGPVEAPQRRRTCGSRGDRRRVREGPLRLQGIEASRVGDQRGDGDPGRVLDDP